MLLLMLSQPLARLSLSLSSILPLSLYMQVMVSCTATRTRAWLSKDLDEPPLNQHLDDGCVANNAEQQHANVDQCKAPQVLYQGRHSKHVSTATGRRTADA